MRPNTIEFLRQAISVVPILEPIIEIGSFQVVGQESISNLRPLFSDKTYIGCDMRPGPGVDRLENVECLTFDNETVGTVIMLDTLEHVEDPIRALQEVFRVLKPGGCVIMSSLMAGPIHAHPNDYWRFTPESFRILLKLFQTKFVFSQGQIDFPHTVMGIGIKTDLDSPLNSIANKLADLTVKEHGCTVTNSIGSYVIRSGVVSSSGGIYPIQSLGLVTASGHFFPLTFKSFLQALGEIRKRL